MGKRGRQALQEMLDNTLRAFSGKSEDAAETRYEHLRARQEDLLKEIAAIQPAQVDLTQEMANDIVRKIHGPLTISQECSDWLRTLASGHDTFWTSPVGYSAHGGQLFLNIKTNGTLFIELRDVNGATMWQATLVPPDFGKEPAGG